MSNGNWVKTFISTKSQVNLTIIPVGDGVTEVTVATIIGGKLMAKDLYTGKDLEKAREAFDNFNRHESESFTEDCMKGNVEEAAPDAKENLEKVIDELDSDENVKSYEMKDEDGNVIVSKDKEEINVGTHTANATEGFNLKEFDANVTITEVGKGGSYWWDGKTLVVIDGDGKDLATEMKDCKFRIFLEEANCVDPNHELHGPGPDSKEGDSKEVESPVENPDAGKTKG